MATAATAASANPKQSPAPASTTDSHASSKKGSASKAKKAADPVNTTKQIEDTIAALERNRAGEKDQEIEIGA